MNKIYFGLGAVAMVGLAGCSQGSESGGSLPNGASGSMGAGGSSASVPFGSVAVGGTAAASPPVVVPSETGQTLNFLPPSAGARYVYVANPARDTVSIIDSTNRAITEITTGDTPTYLATVPGQDVALVINVGSHTLSVLRATAMDANPITVVPKANTLAISPDGLTPWRGSMRPRPTPPRPRQPRRRRRGATRTSRSLLCPPRAIRRSP